MYRNYAVWADISGWKTTAPVEGGHPLRGGVVRSTDLRAGAAMMLAGMIASGETVLQDPAGHIERGYQDLPQKLRALGAEIEQIEDYAGP